MTTNTDDLRISGMRELRAPMELINLLPVSDTAAQTVTRCRSDVRDILKGSDDRMVVVVGPCSIHDPEAALEYAEKLAVIQRSLAADLSIVMRVYFEKPRTTVGWKGLINDPTMDNTFKINEGLEIARRLLSGINEMGLPAGVEYLDLISPQYIADLVGWGAIGARTTESQGHRELASGLSCPVGFKNGTAGSMQIAVDAIGAARGAHNFLSVTKEGNSAIVQTTGNNDCHLILRGGKSHTNYDAASVDDAGAMLAKAGLPERVMIDCSHANSRKLPQRQSYVCRDICAQVSAGDNRIMGVMIESNLVEGSQNPDSKPLVRGQSVTDACLGWDDTVPLLEQLAEAVQKRRTQS
ncbi:3-deoxy-7-phosphoheptulonate synthase [Granulosicoccus antarcticus]|uniref:Phospho-2-dehydro-3-deoxyheptonate aldolase n=1 Tax=Granulosicoccus antarcticus IMCC3135 TaxID=1192854 RepID=A0A2Z2NX37_9GAMM|nr:3-deoxy-7-phosphoheptulonate synthase [Granulosicoccus antarcticus]ASJ75909.1 Phospho-2-dehydro-3-deoxyheptonate aldolase, Phe-sensitive [Granulosicoccus antarcticus IMCC3135]